MDDKDITSKSSVLVSAPPSPSTEELLYRTVYKTVDKAGITNIIWICYHQNPEAVEKNMKTYGLSFQNVRYIDMISNLIGLALKNENAVYCSSPTDYNCLFRSIDELIKKSDKSIIILDNLNAMMSYDMLERIIKTLRSFNNVIAQSNSTILYLETTGGCGMQTEISVRTTMNYVLDLNDDKHVRKSTEWHYFKNTSWHDVLTLNAPLMFILIIIMFVITIFLSSVLIYLIIKSQNI